MSPQFFNYRIWWWNFPFTFIYHCHSFLNINYIPLSFLLFKRNSSSHLNLFLQDNYSINIIFVALCSFSNSTTSPLRCKIQNCAQYPRCKPTQALHSSEIMPSALFPILFLITPSIFFAILHCDCTLRRQWFQRTVNDCSKSFLSCNWHFWIQL